MRFGWVLGVVLLASTTALSTPSAGTDYCVDYKSREPYDCKRSPPRYPKRAQPAQPVPDASDAAANPNDVKRVEQLVAAMNAASQACLGGDIKGFEARMNQAGALATPAEAALLGTVRQNCASLHGAARAAAPASAPPPPAEAAASAPATEPAAPDPTLFVTCGAAGRDGVQTCYEVPERGLGCRKILKKGGDAVWTDEQASCDSAAILQQRNAYFASLPPPTFGAGDANKERALAQMPADCRAELNRLLQGADTNDKEKAYSGYAALRATCDASIRQVASAADARMPERQMTNRSQRFMDRAFAGDAGAVPGVAAQVASGAGGGYDVGEVMEFGLVLLNALSGVAGVYAALPHGAGATYAGGGARRIGGYGQGSPIHIAPRGSPSTITGATH